VPADVARHLGRAALTVSQNGTLVYAAAGSRESRLVWVDRTGRETGVVTSEAGWRDLALSPDGSHVAAQRIVSGANDIWTIDLARGVPSRLTFSPDVDDDPVWSSDGRRIAFSSVRDGVPGIYQKSIDGVGNDELLFTNRTPVHPRAWSPDGRFLLFEQTDPKTASDVWVLPTEGDHSPRPYLNTEFSEAAPQFSPDGKWVAYASDESGRDEVYIIQSFPESGKKVQISTQGGVSPRWAPGGDELFFLSIDRRLMAVKIDLANPLQVATPRPLFDTAVGLGANRYAPAHDGHHFLLSLGTPKASAAPLLVALNWAEHLTITH
jgi:Tol biopolymer transport system component